VCENESVTVKNSVKAGVAENVLTSDLSKPSRHCFHGTVRYATPNLADSALLTAPSNATHATWPALLPTNEPPGAAQYLHFRTVPPTNKLVRLPFAPAASCEHVQDFRWTAVQSSHVLDLARVLWVHGHCVT